MQALKPLRNPQKALPDLLNWAAVISDGVVLCKDGSLIAGYYYQGKDLSVATATERNQASTLVNGALSRLGSEWCLHQDAMRQEARDYPAESENDFTDPISRLIDRERRAQFSNKGNFYESHHAFTLTYLPESQIASKMTDMMFEEEGGNGNTRKKSAADRALAIFEQTLKEIEDLLSPVLSLTRMRCVPYVDDSGRHLQDELLRHLHFCLTGLSHPINLPPCPMYLDAVIGSHEFVPGTIPRLDDHLIQAIAIDGFPQESYPGILALLDQIPMNYRWSTRFIFQDPVDAEKGLVRYRKKWEQKTRGFFDQIFYSKQASHGKVNYDAVEMVSQVTSALTESSGGLVTYGYYTSLILITGDDIESLQESAREAQRLINNLGFAARIESVNTVEAFLGSLPGHVRQNVRRPMLHTLHLADLLPLSSVWAGREFAPCPFYPPKSPPLLHAQTDGSTPFRLNLHIGDTGHTLMIGPTGSGKSTALSLVVAQFRRYRDATVFAFDKGSSLEPLTRAVGGSYYNIAGHSNDSDLCFAPLLSLDDSNEFNWLEDWLGVLIELQQKEGTLTPLQRKELHRSLVVLRDSGTARTLSNLQVTVQDAGIKNALEQYTISGGLGKLLDAEHDDLRVGRWSCFEIEQLMQREDRVKLPVLLYLFHSIERAMKGQPCLLVLDEAWLMLGHPVFKEKIREWLKVLRKNNCAVVMATQSLSDAFNSGILDVLTENCPTKIFLANREANSEENRPLYRAMGCNEAEMQAIAHLIPKRQYFIYGEGKRRVNLAIGPIALSFVGASSKTDLQRIRKLQDRHGEEWPYVWLKERNVNYDYYQ